ncbi:hypothetical protein LCGC14_1995520, partial [marine sediment metagenome]
TTHLSNEELGEVLARLEAILVLQPVMEAEALRRARTGDKIKGRKLVRTAGGVARLSAKDGPHAGLILPSGETRMVDVRCRATIGQLGNLDHGNVRLGKAGRKRHLGRRPHVRGTAQNPVAHPMGGGEGKRAGGRHPCSPTGKLAKGGKTRKKHKSSNKMIIRRRRNVRHGQLKISKK